MSQQDAWKLITAGWRWRLRCRGWIDSPTLNNAVKPAIFPAALDSTGWGMNRHQKIFKQQGRLLIYKDIAVNSKRLVNWFVDPKHNVAFLAAHRNAKPCGGKCGTVPARTATGR